MKFKTAISRYNENEQRKPGIQMLKNGVTAAHLGEL